MNTKPDLVTFQINEISLFPNPRKSVSPEDVADMGESILERGILQPPLSTMRADEVRIYIGQRRFLGLQYAIAKAKKEERAATREGFGSLAEQLSAVDLMVRDITDEEIFFEQVVENLQRKDVSPAEEAEGFFELTRRNNPATSQPYTLGEIARAVGKMKDGAPDEDFVRRRLKLRNAPAELLRAVEAGVVGVTIAEAVGKIPDAASREAATRMILAPEDQEAPYNQAQTKALIRERFMLSLSGSSFDQADENVMPVEHDAEGVRTRGGACSDCPFRSGNMAELAGELNVGPTGRSGPGRKAGITPDLCTNPACYRAKSETSWLVLSAKARASGQTVLDDNAAKKIFTGPRGALAYDSKWTLLDSEPDGALVGWRAATPKWAKLIKGTGVPVVLARNPETRAVVQLVEIKLAVEAVKAAAKAKGETSIFDGRNVKSDEELEKKKEADEKAKTEVVFSYRAAAALREKVAARGMGIDETLALIELALTESGSTGCLFVGKLLGLSVKEAGSGMGYFDPIMEHIQETAPTVAGLQSWVLIALLSVQLKNATGTYGCGVRQSEGLTTFAEIYKLDLDVIEAAARSEITEKTKPAKKGKAPKGAQPKKPAMISRSEAVRRNEDSVSSDEKSAEKQVAKKAKNAAKVDREEALRKKREGMRDLRAARKAGK